MLFKITREQIRAFLITSSALLAIWLFMGHFARFEVISDTPEGQVKVRVSFLAPMNHDRAAQPLTVTCVDMPEREVSFQAAWVSRNTVLVTIDESRYPRGLSYRLEFKKAPAMIPPFSVTAGKEVRLPLVPRLIALDPPDNVPTTGPLTLIFNTPLDPRSFADHVSASAPGSFSPLDPGGQAGAGPDLSRWVLSPQARLNNGQIYQVRLSPGLRSAGGAIDPGGREINFTTAPALEITDIYPRPSDPSVWINRSITVRTSQELKSAEIRVQGMEGKVLTAGNTAVFKPDELFLPARRYEVRVSLTSLHGEKTDREFWFGVTNLGSQRWLEVKLGNPCNFKAYEGSRVIASWQGWLTIPAEKVPRVTMYEVRRGSTSEFNPLDTSPVRFLRLNADITIHHLRAGESHSHSQAGLPPSYGCILINKPDLDWIFNNVPGKCMVVVH